MRDFGRDICGDEHQVSLREWLVTNGIGGYASGTIGGIHTRKYHGLLIAALEPPLGRTLLLSKLDEIVTYDGQTIPLFANRWSAEQIDPTGFVYLERFRLDGTAPIWSFALGDALLEKRIWMQQGTNTTYVSYTLQRASAPLTLTVKALINYRDHHSVTHAAGWQMSVEPVSNGLRVDAFYEATPFYFLSERGTPSISHDWYYNFWLAMENYRGLEPYNDNLYIGDFTITLQPGETWTCVATTETTPLLDGELAYAAHWWYDQRLVAQSKLPDPPDWIRQLVLAADQFVARRASQHDPDGQTILAGYHWFGDWGRDTMISLPGLTLTTGRPEVAARILRTFGQFVDQGMLPNRFPDAGDVPEYNSVDAALWYIEAVRAYDATTSDETLLNDLFPVLEQIIAAYQHGTRYHIRVDPHDGLLAAGEAGVQLTWMDAKVGDLVVTPRIGKPVEINALWYNALCTMAEFAPRTGQSATPYEQAAERAQGSFGRFWNNAVGCCYDVLDSPHGHDDALRPNQLLAVALPHSPLPADQQRAVVDSCAHHLLTSHGLRSLDPRHPNYVGTYGGNQAQRDNSYHQGTVWGWLIGPFICAHLRVYNDPHLARAFLAPFEHHLGAHGVGSISEIFDGDAPFTPRGCIAQAWSVAEVLRAWQAICEV